MFKSNEEIFKELDITLNQLIQNIKATECISFLDLSYEEIEALENTQQSLMAKFIHMSDLLTAQGQKPNDTNELSILEMKLKSLDLNHQSFIKKASLDLCNAGSFINKKPRIGKNRKRLKIG